MEPKPKAKTLSLEPTSLLTSRPCLSLSTHKIQKDGSNDLFGLRGGDEEQEEWSRVGQKLG